MKVIKYVKACGRPGLVIPGCHLDYCDKHKQPVIIVWERTARADVTWLNEPYQCSHSELFSREDFCIDIENRAEEIFKKYVTFSSPISARAITSSFMTLYDLKINDAKLAACDLFDMTKTIIAEYEMASTTV